MEGVTIIFNESIYTAKDCFEIIGGKKIISSAKNIYGAIHGVPDMVVEILSKSTRNRDFGIKKDACESNGVKEILSSRYTFSRI